MLDDSSNQVKVQKSNKYFIYNLGHPAWIIFITLSLFFVSMILAGIIVEVGAAALLNHQTTQLVTQYSAFAQFIYILIAEAMVVATILLILHIKKLPKAAIGLGRRI